VPGVNPILKVKHSRKFVLQPVSNAMRVTRGFFARQRRDFPKVGVLQIPHEGGSDSQNAFHQSKVASEVVAFL